jgi:hypothetical protein
MHLVTVATHSDGYLPYLKKSCNRFKAELTILGWGQKWTGYSFKLKVMKEYLTNIKDNEIVCFIDSFDVILLRPLDELENIFITYSKLTGMKVIVGCDKPPSFIVKGIESIQFGTCHGLLLNSGTYIGYAKEIREMLDHIYIKPNVDDQMMMVQYVQKYPHSIHIDTSSIFFLTINNPTGNFLYNQDIISIKEDKLYYRGIRPFFAHGNGNTNMIDLIKQLNYRVSHNCKLTILSNSYFTQIRKVFEYFYPQLLILIALIIVLLFVIIRKRSKK